MIIMSDDGGLVVVELNLRLVFSLNPEQNNGINKALVQLSLSLFPMQLCKE